MAFQDWVVRNDQPALRSAVDAFPARKTPIRIMSTSTSDPPALAIERNSRSETLGPGLQAPPGWLAARRPWAARLRLFLNKHGVKRLPAARGRVIADHDTFPPSEPLNT